MTVITPILALALVVALVVLIKHTKVGMAMRAASKDFETAQLMGIKINSVISFTFIIGSAAGGRGLVPVLHQLSDHRAGRPAPCRA